MDSTAHDNNNNILLYPYVECLSHTTYFSFSAILKIIDRFDNRVFSLYTSLADILTIFGKADTQDTQVIKYLSQFFSWPQNGDAWQRDIMNREKWNYFREGEIHWGYPYLERENCSSFVSVQEWVVYLRNKFKTRVNDNKMCYLFY